MRRNVHIAAHAVSFLLARRQCACMLVELPNSPCVWNRTTVKPLAGVFQGVTVEIFVETSPKYQIVRSRERFRPCIENTIETIAEIPLPSAGIRHLRNRSA